MNEENSRLTKWAAEHIYEWEIICGIRATGIKNNKRILSMLTEAGFHELSNMISCRVYQLYCDDGEVDVI